MKRVLLTIMSICLVLACLFGLFAVVGGMKDVLNIQDYKTKQGEEGREGIAAARDGIAQLVENETTYLEGVQTYVDGKKTLEDGYAQYYAGQQELAAGQKQIDDNTAAYNEGKELLSKIEPLMPLVNMYVQFRNGTIAHLPGFSDAQAWFTSQVAPLGAQLGLELPADVTDLPGYIQQMVADGKVQLQTYEDGLVTLANGKQQLAAAEIQLADGEKQLADGDAQLKVFEEGEMALIDGMGQLLEAMTAVEKRDGTHQADSLAQMLGDGFELYAKNEDGTVKVLRGVQYVNFENCSKLCDAGEAYLDLQEEQIASELYGRIGLYAVLAIACILGIIGGLIGFVGAITGGKKTGFVTGLISLILAGGANVAGMFMGYNNYAYPVEIIGETGLKTYEYSGDLQLRALIVVAVVALIFVIIAAIARSAAKKAEAKEAAEATRAAAEAAATKIDNAGSEKLAELAAENAELKEMVSKLAAEIATSKE